MSKQLDLFKPEPMIGGETNMAGKDAYYDRRRMVWTSDPAELGMSDDEIAAHWEREKQLSEFDSVFGPPEAWK